MKTKLILIFLALSTVFIQCKKDDPTPESNHVISAKVNGANFFMVRDVNIEFKNNTLKVQGNDFVDNYLEFTVTDVMEPGVHVMPTAKFFYVDNQSNEYIAEQKVGVMTITELTATKLVGDFTMTLNNVDEELLEVTQGKVDLELN